MKILLTTDTVGGVWTYALELAAALAPHGVEADLATMGAPLSEGQRAEAAALSNVRLHESAYRLEWMSDPWDEVRRAGEWLLELEARLRPDLVHLNGYAHGALPWRAPTLVVGHSCVLSWWEAVKGEPAPADWDRYREEVTRGLRAATLAGAPTRAMLASLQRHYGPLDAARVLPNGRDPALFRPQAKQPLVLAAGRLWDEAKNVAALDRVAPRLAWPVYVAGDDLHPDGGRLCCANLRLLGRLTRPELADRLGAASIYALPARYEPFGLSVLEAAFAGCALVLGDLPSLREVWDDDALFVPPDDGAALAAALQSLIADEAGREALARRARTRAFQYTPERLAAGYLGAYQHLLAPPVPSDRPLEASACAS
jgi:glycosyltransferase involved in cell wall biosynthesis